MLGGGRSPWRLAARALGAGAASPGFRQALALMLCACWTAVLELLGSWGAAGVGRGRRCERWAMPHKGPYRRAPDGFGPLLQQHPYFWGVSHLTAADNDPNNRKKYNKFKIPSGGWGECGVDPTTGAWALVPRHSAVLWTLRSEVGLRIHQPLSGGRITGPRASSQDPSLLPSPASILHPQGLPRNFPGLTFLPEVPSNPRPMPCWQGRPLCLPHHPKQGTPAWAPGTSMP